ncbi:hypothetical protein EB077_14070 [bacterium]|nr:hypothetical protein [bacterium]
MGRNKTSGVGLPGTEIVNPGGLSDDVVRAHVRIFREANAAIRDLQSAMEGYIAGSDASRAAREAAVDAGNWRERDRILTERQKERDKVTTLLLKAQSVIARDFAFSIENNSPIPEKRREVYRQVLEFARDYKITTGD